MSLIPALCQFQATPDYQTLIKNPLHFRLVVNYLSHGLSFRQIEPVLESTKRIALIDAIGSVYNTKISNMARIILAVNINIIRSAVESAQVWAFSIALDSSSHRGGSYFAFQVRSIILENL